MSRAKAYFFDMDGVLFNSMPNHAIAWVEVMKKHNLAFTAYDCYINEGRTGSAVIREAIWNAEQREASEEELKAIYAEKAAHFNKLTTDANQPTPTIDNVDQVLQYVKACENQIWVVTGSGQRTLINNLQAVFPGIFKEERMITAFDVKNGKPDPEPYLKAWERSGLKKEDCIVIENAPLGVQSGKAAGLRVYAVNTGILRREDLSQADQVFDSMIELLDFLKKEKKD